MIDQKGIAILMEWARAHGAVLEPIHKRIAKAHGVSTEGVVFNEHIQGRID